MADTSKSIDRLKDRERQIKAQIRAAESKEKDRKKKLETRKKIVLGGFLMNWMKEDDEIQAKVTQELDKILSRNVDREAMGFPLLPETRTKKAKPQRDESASS